MIKGETKRINNRLPSPNASNRLDDCSSHTECAGRPALWQRDGGIQVTLAEDEYAKQKVWINDNTS